ncbi:cell adhesion molecule Dscam2-like [Haemaphysalis longicornis]
MPPCMRRPAPTTYKRPASGLHQTSHLCVQAAATIQILIVCVASLEASSIKVTPKIIAFSFAGTAKPGNNVRTTCLLAEGDMPVTFTWLRNGVDASHSKNVHIVSHSDFSVLSINPVDGQSAGNYTCIAKNRAGFDSFTAFLDVEAPPNWLREPQDMGGTLGTALLVPCAASGSPPPTIRWFKLQGGESPFPNKPAQPLETNQNGSLVIQQLEPHHAGQYVCEAGNGINPTLRKTISVKVTGGARYHTRLNASP